MGSIERTLIYDKKKIVDNENGIYIESLKFKQITGIFYPHRPLDKGVRKPKRMWIRAVKFFYDFFYEIKSFLLWA
ncbi:hypothetical protein NE619_08230 [Anaerovorax odorimutans]|uniref:Uncharacterized protein n=1 Tax=Anaerovorax odorimutans TaxID=109327 RepID=A0ABT1RNF4_9FIRM|nr:hypothetical protein [Anaerovorax odorimutans]